MTKLTLTTLGDILTMAKSKRISIDYDLYLRDMHPWTTHSVACLLPVESDFQDSGVSEFAEKHDVTLILNGQDVNGVVQNAVLQKPEVSVEELIVAFNFYIDHDAFMGF